MGASAQECEASLPGDEFIASPDLTATRAITVHAPVGRVWPWIAQLGQGRGGFYGYDFLENLAGCDIHSADRIVAEWQAIKIGDEIKLAPAVGLEVTSLEPGRSLVLRGGAPMGNTPPSYDFTWAWVLRDEADALTGAGQPGSLRTAALGLFGLRNRPPSLRATDAPRPGRASIIRVFTATPTRRS